MERHPIIKRKPVISRTAIYHRVACCSELVKCESCSLCKGTSDCSGNSYGEDSNSKVIFIDHQLPDWSVLEDEIWDLESQKVYLRLITTVDLPKEIVWAASYSEHNILQINLDLTQVEPNIYWIRQIMSVSSNCGLYNVLFLYPIIPDLIKTYHVIEVIDMFRNTVHFHVNLKFSEITNVSENEGYLNFNGEPVSTEYLVEDNGVWKCTQEYLDRFLDIVNLYTVPRKISVSICGKDNKCTGMGGCSDATKS